MHFLFQKGKIMNPLETIKKMNKFIEKMNNILKKWHTRKNFARRFKSCRYSETA